MDKGVLESIFQKTVSLKEKAQLLQSQLILEVNHPEEIIPVHLVEKALHDAASLDSFLKKLLSVILNSGNSTDQAFRGLFLKRLFPQELKTPVMPYDKDLKEICRSVAEVVLDSVKNEDKKLN